MSVMRIGLASVVAALLGLNAARGQTTPTPPASPGSPGLLDLYSQQAGETSPYAPSGSPAPPQGAPAGQPPPQPFLMGTMSSWLVYPRAPGCCGRVGCNGPIQEEVFFRSGLAFPIGGGIFGENLRDGWDIEGGGRVLFFDPSLQHAFTIMGSVSNIFNRMRTSVPVGLVNVPEKTSLPGATLPTPVTITVPFLTATPQNYNQTFVNLAGGYEWYLWGNGDLSSNGINWRIGCDVGGRYGSARVTFDQIQHHTDVVGGPFVAVHSDLEVPFRCAVFQAGIRLEYNYIFDDALQAPNPSDYQSLNLLFQVGARF